MIYRPGDPIPNGDLIRAYILHWLNFDPTKHTVESITQRHRTEKLMQLTLNEISTIIPKVPTLEDVEIEA